MQANEIVPYIFLVLAIITFGKLIRSGDDEDKKLQKIFGGLIILVTALLTKSEWVVGVSIFISGLIVASEDFMRFLAAIMRTSGDKVADTVRALKTEKATVKEVEKKLEGESKDVVTDAFEGIKTKKLSKISPPDSPSTNLEICPAPAEEERISSSEVFRARMAKIRTIENLIQPHLKTLFGDSYEPHMKVSNGDKFMIFDGIVRRNGKIKLVIEIRFLTQKSFHILPILINKFRDKLYKLGIRRRVLFIVVSEEITKDDAEKMSEYNKLFAALLFYKFVDNKLELIET